MKKIYVGTSGWSYSWNLGGNLEWYVENSGLNAVELNASFYTYPYPSQLRFWMWVGRKLRWSVKVHRSITHLYRLSEKSYSAWERFRKYYKPIEDLTDFYLIQLPPTYDRRESFFERIIRFARETSSRDKIAVEFRHLSWFRESPEKLCEELDHIVIVSVDSPDITWFVSCRGIVYLRLHGRSEWYFHNYTEEELREIAARIKDLSPDSVYVFFNNNHWMLENARRMLDLLTKK